MKHLKVKLFSGFIMCMWLTSPVWAQATGAQVTYRPVDLVPIPTLSGFAMVLLGVLLFFLAWRVGRSGKWMNRVSSVAVLTITATVSMSFGVNNIYAVITASEIMIQGDECLAETTEFYDPYAASAMLTSTCGNRVEIASVEFNEECAEVPPESNACEAESILGNGDSCNLSVCEPVVQAGECQGGAVELSVSPGGDMKVCDDPTDTVCEQDVETLCPVGWQLCSYQQHVQRNDGWTYPLSSAGNTVVAEIYCRSSGAGHFTLGPYNSPANLGVDIPGNCGYGSSRDSCTSNYGCNETQVQALCCLPSPSCGNGVVDSPEEQCDDGNLDETDDCFNNCTSRNLGGICN